MARRRVRGSAEPVYIVGVEGDYLLVDITDRIDRLIGAVQLVDEHGVPFGVTQTDNRLRVSATSFLYDVARGSIPEREPWISIGYNPNIGTTEEDLWDTGGVYAWPAAEQQMVVVSTSAADDGNPPGLGARTVTIYYLDDAYAEHSVTLTMDGLTPVNTGVTDIFRVNSFRTITAGTTAGAVGTITLKNIAGTITYGSIAIGYTRDRNTCYTVPAAKKLYIASVMFSVYGANKGIRYTLRTTYDDDADANRDFFIPHLETNMTNGAIFIPLLVPLHVPTTGRVKVSGMSDQAGAVCSCSMNGWLEDV